MTETDQNSMPPGAHDPKGTTCSKAEPDPEIENWKRVRSAIEHENTLTHYRITWLFSAQAFLFASFVVEFNQAAKCSENSVASQALFPWILWAITVAGMLISFATWNGLAHGGFQLQRLDNWWHLPRGGRSWGKVTMGRAEAKEMRREGQARLSDDHPPIQGGKSLPTDRIFTLSMVSLGLGLIWLLLFGMIGMSRRDLSTCKASDIHKEATGATKSASSPAVSTKPAYLAPAACSACPAIPPPTICPAIPPETRRPRQ